MNLESLPVIGWILRELAALRAMIEGLHAHVQLPAPPAAEPQPVPAVDQAKPAPATVAQASTPAPTTTVAPTGTGTVVFDPAQYPDPAERIAAIQKVAGEAIAKYGYHVKIVDPQGNEVDVRGNPIVAAQGDAGWQPGSILDAFGVGRQNSYSAGVPFPYSVTVPSENFEGGGFEFVWADCPGTPDGTATVVVSGPAGTFSGSSFLKLGSVKVPGSKPGEAYSVTLTASASGSGHAQINPLAVAPSA